MATLQQVAQIELPEDWQELDLNDRFNWIEANTPFYYLYDGLDWSSGVWTDADGDTINNGGGSFKWFGAAVAAVERFMAAARESCRSR